MMDDTVYKKSLLGERLEKIHKTEHVLLFKDKEIPIISKITIGRHRKNNIAIDDKLASRNHAVIQKIKEEYFLKDLNSTNGTFINDKGAPKGKYVKLNKGDVIRIGKTDITMS
ncbi:FHA domain-containing protein [Spirochaetota bacterium]